MSVPSCPKCPSTMFQATAIEPHGARYKLTAIHCIACGATVGVTENRNVPTLLDQMTKQLAAIGDAIQKVEREVRRH